jgi:hypothetical protein
MRRGGALVVALVTLLIVMLIAGTVARSLVSAARQSRRLRNEVQAQWLADAALARGVALAQSQPDYAGETWWPGISTERSAVAEIRIARPASGTPLKVSVVACYPDEELHRVRVSREYVASQQEAVP